MNRNFNAGRQKYFDRQKFSRTGAAAKGEKPEDKAGLDKEFSAQQKKLARKLAREKQYEHWIYKVPAYLGDPLLKTRSQLLVETKTNAPATTSP